MAAPTVDRGVADKQPGDCPHATDEPLAHTLGPCPDGTTGGESISRAELVLRVAMTAGDIPDWTGAPDQGYEGYRFVGFSLV